MRTSFPLLNPPMHFPTPYHHRLVKSHQSFRLALCDSFNTPEALGILQTLVSRANVYISQSGAKPNVAILESVASWVSKMLRMFGLGEGPAIEGTVGWGECVLDGDGVGMENRNVSAFNVLSSC